MEPCENHSLDRAACDLKRGDPGLRICILEHETTGFAAPGRNGGWCIGSTAPMYREGERRQMGNTLRF